MTKKRQKIFESHYLYAFKKHFSEFPSGEILAGEEPDFVVDDPNSGRSCGIEVANFYISDGSDFKSEQRQKAARVRLLRKIEKDYSTVASQPYVFYIDFDPRMPILDDLNRHKEIVHAIRNLVSSKTKVSLYRPFVQFPEIRHIYAELKSGSVSEWNLNQVYEVPLVDWSRVSTIIEGKSNKVKSYQPCDRYWLLLVIESWDPAQDQVFPNNVSQNLVISPFERVFIYKTVTNEVVELLQ